MPRNSTTGVYEAPSNSFNPAEAGTIIEASAWNAILVDMETALSSEPAETRAEWAALSQVQDQTVVWGGVAGGTADARSITLTPAITEYTAGQTFRFINGPDGNNGGMTLTVNGLSAKSIVRPDNTAVQAGDLPASSVVTVIYDGTSFRVANIVQSQVNPSLGGNALKFLQVNSGETGTQWTDVNVDGGTGSLVTTATTLTSASDRVQRAAMATSSQSFTLPSATTLSEGGPTFVFANEGSREFGVRANGGQLIARVGAGLTVSVYLRDNSTAAGQWAVEGQDAFIPLTICDTTLSSTYTNAQQVAVRLSDTLSLHFVRNSSSHPFVFAVDHSTYPATVGTPVLIVAAARNIFNAFRISAAKGLLIASSSEQYNITVSGTTCTVSTASTGAVFSSTTFTGRPLIAALTDSLYVALDLSAGAVRAQALDASGTNPSAGSSVNVVASGGQQALAVYRVSDTTAVAFYIDDSGTGGSPYSIRAVVLSVSGTTVTVGTSAGVNDVVSSVTLPIVQLTTASYIVGYYQASGTLIRAVHIGVSGTTVTFGTPLTVETVSLGDQTYVLLNASRFQPNLSKLSDTTALFTYGLGSGTTPSRHAVITNASGTLSGGTILYGTWTDANGGNFPQRTDSFLAFSTATAENEIYQASVSGTDVSITGTFALPGSGAFPLGDTLRFGLSGNYFGIGVDTAFGGRLSLFRSRSNGAPQYLGAIALNNSDWGTTTAIPVELASNRAAFIFTSQAQAGGTTALVRLVILEFPL